MNTDSQEIFFLFFGGWQRVRASVDGERKRSYLKGNGKEFILESNMNGHVPEEIFKTLQAPCSSNT